MSARPSMDSRRLPEPEPMSEWNNDMIDRIGAVLILIGLLVLFRVLGLL